MQVKAAPGIRVPKEDHPRRYITEHQVEDVPRSAYYLRILAEGDLVEATEATPSAETPATDAEPASINDSEASAKKAAKGSK